MTPILVVLRANKAHGNSKNQDAPLKPAFPMPHPASTSESKEVPVANELVVFDTRCPVMDRRCSEHVGATCDKERSLEASGQCDLEAHRKNHGRSQRVDRHG